VALLLENGDVSGVELRRAIQDNPPVQGAGGGGGAPAEGAEEGEFADLEAVFQKFRFDEGFVPEEDDAEDWIEDERRSYAGEGEDGEGEGGNGDALVDDGDGAVAAAPRPSERPEPVRPRATSPAAIREGFGLAPEPPVSALQAALSDAVEDAQSYDEAGISEEEGREETFWADEPVGEMKLWTM